MCVACVAYSKGATWVFIPRNFTYIGCKSQYEAVTPVSKDVASWLQNLGESNGIDCVDHNKLWKILKEMVYQTTWPASWETYMQVRKQQLELDMEQQTGSK